MTTPGIGSKLFHGGKKYPILARSKQKRGFADPSLCFLSVAEANLSIVCACMPVLKPLIRKFIPSLLANSRREVKATRDTTIELRPSLVTTEVLVTSQSRRLSMEDRLGGVGISAGYVEKA